MKKTYIAPSTEVTFAETINMMAVSLPTAGGTSGDTADADEDQDWDVWSDKD